MLGSRRRRPPDPPLTSATANPNAAMAAAAVFKSREQQQPSLSSAAAAAALRARPPTPTNVSEVQTKRTIRRSTSVSSAGSVAGPGKQQQQQQRPPLQRRGSSASMSEKTFRNTSPHRPATSAGPGHQRRISSTTGEEIPPVPTLPEKLPETPVDDADSRSRSNAEGLRPQPRRRGQHDKAHSLGGGSVSGAPPVRLASQVLGKEGTPSWFAGAQVGDMRSVRTWDAAIENRRPESAQDDGRPSSRSSSVNFSYPSRIRIGPSATPPIGAGTPEPAVQAPSPDTTRVKRTPSSSSSVKNQNQRPVSSASVQSLVYDPNSRRMVPRYEAPVPTPAPAPTPSTGGYGAKAIASGKPGKKQRDARAGPVRRAREAADHRPSADLKARQSTASPRPAQQPERVAPQETTLPAHREEPFDERTHQEAVGPSSARLGAAPPSGDTAASRPVSGQHQQYRVVKEGPETEDDGEKRQADEPSVSAAVDAVPTKQKIRSPPELPAVSSPPPPRQQPAELPGEPVAAPAPPTTSDEKATRAKTGNLQQPDRTHSASPVRTARFGTVRDGPSVKYSPPPRSISPRKSALKQHSPCRGASASPDGGSSEASGSAQLGDEQQPAASRKKSVRVSFDDANNVVVAAGTPEEAADPSTSTAPTTARRPWYSNITRPKRSDFGGLDDGGDGHDDDGEVMKPRPALPSFGSVRDKKPRGGEVLSSEGERPLVRPYESRGAGLPAEEEGPSPAVDSSSSSDRALGNLLAAAVAADQRKRNAANISRFREPLPPVVTSVDGNSSFMSDSSSDSEQDGGGSGGLETIAESPPTTPHEAVEDTVASSMETPAEVSGPNGPAPAEEAGGAENQEEDSTAADLPTVTISQPTPPPETPLSVPGGFPEDDEPDESNRGADPSTSRETEHSSISSLTPTAPTTNSPATAADDDDDDDDETDNSVYSDAYETPQDDDDGGFLSLDAVVDSPVARGGNTTRVLREADPRPSSLHVSPSNRDASSEPMGSAVAATSNRHSVHGSLGHYQQPDARHPSYPEAAPPMPVSDFSSATALAGSRQMTAPEDGWERAKAYLRSLSAEKRAQLEREARDEEMREKGARGKEAGEEEGAEGDHERSPNQESQKSQKKKKKRATGPRKPDGPESFSVHPAQQQNQQRPDSPPPPQNRTYSVEPGTKVDDDFILTPSHEIPPMRRTMRRGGGPAPGGGPRRNTEREGTLGASLAAVAARPGSRDSAAAATALSTRRPSDRHPEAAAAAETAPNLLLLPSPLQRRGSASSESSFKRSRPGASHGQGLGFKKTLRQPISLRNNNNNPNPNSNDNHDNGNGGSLSRRFSLRSLSPAGSSFSRSSPAASAGGMRQTLRGSPASEGGKIKRSLGKSSGIGSSLRSRLGGGSSKASSRFADSSDDDDGEDDRPRRARFQSRFADSSDEDGNAGPQPSQLTQQPPRRRPTTAPERRPPSTHFGRGKLPGDWLEPAGDGHEASAASPALPEELEDLKEEEEENPPLPTTTATTKATSNNTTATPATATTAGGSLRRSRSGRGGLAGSRTMPEMAGAPKKKRNGWMAALRRRKTDAGGGGGGGIHRPEVMDSAARRDTRLERSASELIQIRSITPNEEQQQRQQQVRSPRLQKRATTPVMLPTVDWPLPGEDHHDEQQQGGGNIPTASGGPHFRHSGLLSNLGTRTLSSNPRASVSVSAASAAVASAAAGRPATTGSATAATGPQRIAYLNAGEGGGGNKKKFGALRRMLRLDD